MNTASGINGSEDAQNILNIHDEDFLNHGHACKYFEINEFKGTVHLFGFFHG